MAIEKSKNVVEWDGRKGILEITWNEISDRKFGDLPRIQVDWTKWRSPEPPDQDWFG
jgi:hypothetical protein